VKSELPKRVHLKHGSYYYVAQNRWVKLCRVQAGLPTLYRKIAEHIAADTLDDSITRLIGDWLVEVSASHAKKTQENDAYMCREVGKAFIEFRSKEVTPPDVMTFLKAYKAMPRSFNAYRGHIRELMRFAEEKGWRPAGSNPVDSIKTKPRTARNRYITDSELRRVKVGAIYSNPHPTKGYRTKNRSGLMLCALVDMAYLTGQRIGDLLTMEWSDVKPHGILFEPAKVAGSTGVKVLIEWTPKLRNVVERLKALKRADITRWMFTTQGAQKFTYSGASTAWKRAVKRAGVRGVTFHDLKAKALTDVDDARGMHDAQKMGGHSTQAQTADYVRHKKAKKTGATR
jgi:integrase